MVLAGQEDADIGRRLPPYKYVKKPWFQDKRKGSSTLWSWYKLL